MAKLTTIKTTNTIPVSGAKRSHRFSIELLLGRRGARGSGQYRTVDGWPDERHALNYERTLSRSEDYSRNDMIAAQVVAAGAGTQTVIEATGLRTRANVLRLLDPAILKQSPMTPHKQPPATWPANQA